MDEKIKLSLKHLCRDILDRLVFREILDKEDDEYKLLEEYLPYTLSALAESDNEKHVKFIDLLQEYNWELSATDEEREWSHTCCDVGRVGKITYVSVQEGVVMAKSNWDIINDFDGDDTNYTIFLEFCNGYEGQILDIDYAYVLELEWDGDSCDEDSTLQEDEYSVTGLGIRIFDVTSDTIFEHPMKKVFKYDEETLSLLNGDEYDSI